MKSLIVNADDVGFSDAINEAARNCYLSGAITGVSVLACGRRFQEACAMLHDLGKTEVGVHLTLTGNLPPCTEQRLEIRTLLRDKDLFVGNYWDLMSLYFRKKLKPEQIHLELANQIRRVKGEGLKVTHLDSHEHIHMFPEVLKITRALAEEFDVPYIRLPLENGAVIRKQFSLKDLLRHAGLKAFTLRSKGIFSGTQVKSNDFFMGHFHSGRIDDDILTFMMENLAEGVTELAVHPAVMSRELLEESPWHRNAQKELDTLINGGWRARTRAGDIRLISHSQI
ncbi:MAG: ChbG/HpnK family deacetylase [Candidatus Omnitrophota bacterium]